MPPLDKPTNLTTSEAFVVDRPWGDGDWVVLGNPDPHLATILADCSMLDDTQGEDPSLPYTEQEAAAEIARRWNLVPALEAERDELRAENATMRDTLAHATRTYAANVDELRAEQSKWRSHLDAVLTFAGCDHDSRGEEGECVGCAVRGDAYNALRVAYGLDEVDQPADDVQSLIEVKAERDELRAALTTCVERIDDLLNERPDMDADLAVRDAAEDALVSARAALTNEGAPE